VGKQVERLLGAAVWCELEPASILVVPTDHAGLLGLKAVLTQRLQPLMNSHLLYVNPC